MWNTRVLRFLEIDKDLVMLTQIKRFMCKTMLDVW